jgi:hypothetical protein
MSDAPMRKVWILLFLAAAALLPLAMGAGKGNPNPGVIPPQANYSGASYDEWSARWWQWCYAIPIDGHPLYDLTGENAAVGQSGHVWFLGGVVWKNNTTPPPLPVTRTITIPSGTALFFPIVNGELNFAEVPDAPSVEALREMLDDFIGSLTNNEVYATIDGRPVRDIVSYRAISPEFEIWLPDDSILEDQGYVTGAGEVEPVVADGLFLMVPPLSVGKHTITFGVQNLPWSLDIVYNITVAPGKK